MGRRNDHTREDIHSMALVSALQIVREEGPEALSARRVAAAIGYSPGTLYNVFDNLDDLVLQLDGAILESLHVYMVEASKDKPARERLAALGKAYVTFTRDHRNLWTLLFERPMPDVDALPEWYTGRIEALFEVIGAALADLFPSTGRPELAQEARILWAGLHGICLLTLTQRPEVLGGHGIDTLTDTFITNYVAGLDARYAG